MMNNSSSKGGQPIAATITVTTTGMIPPRVVLSNGVRLVNFASSRSFEFQDGSTLRGCQPERVSTLRLQEEETRTPVQGGRWDDIQILFFLTDIITMELAALEVDDSVDVIIVERLLIDSLRRVNEPIGKCRTVRDAGRRKRVYYIGKFCV